jgi:hypothetical protein
MTRPTRTTTEPSHLGLLRSSPTPDFGYQLGRYDPAQLVNLTALMDRDHIELVARFANRNGTHLATPLTIALTADHADQLAGSLHRHALYLDAALVGHPRWH